MEKITPIDIYGTKGIELLFFVFNLLVYFKVSPIIEANKQQKNIAKNMCKAPKNKPVTAKSLISPPPIPFVKTAIKKKGTLIKNKPIIWYIICSLFINMTGIDKIKIKILILSGTIPIFKSIIERHSNSENISAHINEYNDKLNL